MEFFLGAFAIVTAAATFYAIYRQRFLVGCGPAYLCVISVTWFVLERNTEGYRPPPQVDALADSRPKEEPFDGYVTSDTCRSCHPGQYHSWHATYHRTMTQVASPDSVLAEFDGRIFQDGGLAFAVEKRGDEVWAKIYPAHLAAPTGTDVFERRFVMTTGSHHYQIYWLDGDYNSFERADDRRISIFPYVYLIDDKQWIPRNAAFVMPPHPDGNSLDSGDWNTNCLNCHATHGAPQTVLSDEIMTTRAAEFGISCEACHGPGEAHVLANRDPLRRYGAHHAAAAGLRDETIVNPAHLGKELSAHVCARCHSMTGGFYGLKAYPLHGYGFRPGQDLYKTFVRSRYDDWKNNPALKAELKKNPAILKDYFWSDGMIRVAGREFNGLLETKCFQDGEMSCLSCHQLHKTDADPRSLHEWADDQLGPGRHTNAACIQCHESFGNDAAVAAHTHHPLNNSSSNCYNCHMPHTTFGLLKAIRSHTVDSPSVAASIATGRPNACNQCHLDKSLGWTARTLNQWFGTPVPEMNADERDVAASVLWTLKGDAGQRALMAWSFGWEEARGASGDDWMPVYLALLLEDPYAAVQIVARKSLRKYPGFETLSDFPFPPDVKSRAFMLWQRRHAAGLRSGTSHLLLESDGTFDLENAERILSERDHTPINLKE